MFVCILIVHDLISPAAPSAILKYSSTHLQRESFKSPSVPLNNQKKRIKWSLLNHHKFKLDLNIGLALLKFKFKFQLNLLDIALESMD